MNYLTFFDAMNKFCTFGKRDKLFGGGKEERAANMVLLPDITIPQVSLF